MTPWRLGELRQRFGVRVWWYCVGTLVLSVVFLVLTVEISMVFMVEHDTQQRTLRAKSARLQAISNEVAPFRGLNGDIAETRNSIARFYSDRFPDTYSQILTGLGDDAMHAGVSLSHVVYSEGRPGSDLSEVSMDVAAAGTYPQLIHFVNGIERDRHFFVIRAVSFSGQQGGDVTLHIRLSTWLRMQQQDGLFSVAGKPPVAKVEPAATGGK